MRPSGAACPHRRERSALAPDLPTAAESGLPSLVYVSWYGAWAPKATPLEIIVTLNGMMNEATKDLVSSGRLATLGIEPVTETPEQFASYIAADVARNAELLKAADFKPE